MDTLVHQGAAVLLPGTSPGSSVIILVVSRPANVGCTIEELAKTALIHGLTNLLDGSIEAVLVAGADLDPLLMTSLNNSVSILKR